MALASTARGTNTSNSSGTNNLTIAPSGNFAARSLPVLVVAYDNSGTSGADPFGTGNVSDSLGNVWTSRHATLRDPGAASAGTTLRIFTCAMQFPLTTGTTITFTTQTATTAKVCALWEITAGSGNVAVYLATGTGAGNATTTPSVTTSSIAVGDLVVGAVANEYGTAQTLTTPDADSTNGTWSTNQYTEIGTTTSGQNITTQTKVQTTTGSTQTYNLTMGTSTDWAAGWISVDEVSATQALTLGLLDASPALYAPTVANAPIGTCALVVGDSGSPTSGDSLIQGRIEGLGYTVTLVDDSASAELTKDIVVIAESVSSANVGTKYATTTLGVMVMEAGLTDDMDMATAGGGTGAGITSTTLQAADQGVYQDLKAGLSGATTIAGSNITPAGNVLAEIPNANTGSQIFNTNTLRSYWAYDTGATMENAHGAAEGRRVFFGYGIDTDYANLNANGLALMDAAITWIAETGSGTQTITLGLLDAGPALYAPTVVKAPYPITLALLDASPALFAPALAAKNTITLGLLTSTSALYAPTVLPQPVTVTLGLLTSTSALYAPSLTPKNTLTLGLLDAAPALYAPALAAKNTITLALLDAGPALYAPTLVGKNLVTLGLLTSTSTLFAPTLAPQPVTVTLTLLDSGSALYAPTVSQASGTQSIDLGLLDASSALYAPVIAPQPVTIVLDLLDGASALYAPSLSQAGGTQSITLALLDSGSALYAPSLAVGAVTITLGLLDAGAATYAPTLAPQPVGITLVLLDGGAVLYAPTLAFALATSGIKGPTGIATSSTADGRGAVPVAQGSAGNVDSDALATGKGAAGVAVIVKGGSGSNG